MNEIIGTKIYRKCQFPEKNVTVSTIYNGNYFFIEETTFFGSNLNQKFNSLIANPIPILSVSLLCPVCFMFKVSTCSFSNIILRII